MKKLLKQVRDAYREAFSEDERRAVLIFILSIGFTVAASYFWPFARPAKMEVCIASLLAGCIISIAATARHKNEE